MLLRTTSRLSIARKVVPVTRRITTTHNNKQNRWKQSTQRTTRRFTTSINEPTQHLIKKSNYFVVGVAAAIALAFGYMSETKAEDEEEPAMKFEDMEWDEETSLLHRLIPEETWKMDDVTQYWDFLLTRYMIAYANKRLRYYGDKLTEIMSGLLVMVCARESIEPGAPRSALVLQEAIMKQPQKLEEHYKFCCDAIFPENNGAAVHFIAEALWRIYSKKSLELLQDLQKKVVKRGKSHPDCGYEDEATRIQTLFKRRPDWRLISREEFTVTSLDDLDRLVLHYFLTADKTAIRLMCDVTAPLLEPEEYSRQHALYTKGELDDIAPLLGHTAYVLLDWMAAVHPLCYQEVYRYSLIEKYAKNSKFAPTDDSPESNLKRSYMSNQQLQIATELSASYANGQLPLDMPSELKQYIAHGAYFVN